MSRTTQTHFLLWILLASSLTTFGASPAAASSCPATDEECLRDVQRICTLLIEACEEDPATSCPYGGVDRGAWCEAPPICQDSLNEEHGSCPDAPPCPLGEFHRGCQPRYGWSSTPCSQNAPWRNSESDAYTCTPRRPAAVPACSDLGGELVNGTCQTPTPATAYTPSVALYAQDTCDPAGLRLRLTWYSRAHNEEPNETRSWHVYLDQGMGFVHWATLPITSDAYTIDAAFTYEATYQIRLRYQDSTGSAWSPTTQSAFYSCAAAELVNVALEPEPEACVQWTRITFNLDEQDPRRTHSLRYVDVTRTPTDSAPGASTVRRVFLNHPLLERAGTTEQGHTLYEYEDHYLPQGSFEYRIETDYGTRGHYDATATLTGPTVGACRPPEILAVEAHAPTPSTGSDPPATLQRIDVSWTWSDWEADMDHWLQYVLLLRRESPGSTTPEVAAYDEDGHSRVAGTRILAYLKPPEAGSQVYRDYNVHAGTTYEYQFLIRPYPWRLPSLYSNMAHASVEGLPHPPTELRVETQPYLHRNESHAPPPGGYPSDLPQRMDQYGVALIDWQPGPDGGSPITEHEVQWQSLGGSKHTCRYADEELQSGAVQLPLVYPDSFRDEAHCTNTKNVADAFPPGARADVTVYAWNEYGRGHGTYVLDVQAWDLPRPAGIHEDRTTDAANDGWPTPIERRSSIVSRTDEVVHRVVTVHNDLSAGYRVGDTPPFTRPERAIESPVHQERDGVLCQSDGVLQVLSQRIDDERLLGFLFDQEPEFRSLDLWDLLIQARSQGFDTNPPDRAGDPELPEWRVQDYWNDATSRRELQDASWVSHRDDETRHGEHGWWNDWNDLFPLTPSRESPALPFNAIGDYCWLDGLYLTANTTSPATIYEHQLPRSAVHLDLDSTQYSFTHTAQESGVTERRAYNHGARGGNTCYCLYQSSTRVDDVHRLRQEFQSPYNWYAQLDNTGTTMPLAGSESLYWDSLDELDGADTVFARYERLVDDHFTAAFQAELQAYQREELPYLYRWDARDALPSQTPTALVESRTVTHAWLELRPDWGAKDRAGTWYVPGNFVPVAYLGGLHDLARPTFPDGEWTYRYAWGRSLDGQAWQAWSLHEDVPWMNRPLAIDHSLYEQGHGTIWWRVEVNATLTTSDGRVADWLELNATAAFRLDRTTLADAEPLDLGVPVLKDDQDPNGHHVYRGTWYTWPWAAAPWELPSEDPEWWRESRSQDHPIYWNAEDEEVSLPAGQQLRWNLENLLRVVDADPTRGIRSMEEPRLGRPASSEEVEAFRAEDTFVRVLYQSSPDATRSGDTRLAIRINTVEDLRGSFDYLNPQSSGALNPDGDAFPVRKGDVLEYLLYVSPVQEEGELVTGQAGGDGSRAARERSRVHVAAVYTDGSASSSWEQPVEAALNQWTRVRVPLEAGKHVQEFQVRAMPHLGDVEGEAYHVFYYDDVTLHSPSRDRTYHLHNALSTAQASHDLVAEESRGLHAAWVEDLDETREPLQRGDDDSGLEFVDPSNPFLHVTAIPHPFQGEATAGWLRQPHWINGLLIGLPAADTSEELDELRYTVPDEDDYTQNPFLRGFTGTYAGGRGGIGTYVPHDHVYDRVWATDAWLRLDDPDSTRQAPRPGSPPQGVVVEQPSLNHVALAQVWPAYSYTILAEDPREPAQDLDYLHYDIRDDQRRGMNPDATRQPYTGIPGIMLDGHVQVAAAPVGPFLDTKPILIQGPEDAYTLDLNTKPSWDLFELQDQIHDEFDAQRHSWVRILPYDSTLTGCYRWSPSEEWRPVSSLHNDTHEERSRVYVKFWLNIYQGTPENREMAEASKEDADCTPPALPAASLRVEELELVLEQAYGIHFTYVTPDPDDPEDWVVRYIELGARADGSYEFTYRPYDDEVTFVAVHDDALFFTHSARLQIGNFPGEEDHMEDGRLLWVVLALIAILGGVLLATYLVRVGYHRLMDQ